MKKAVLFWGIMLMCLTLCSCGMDDDTLKVYDKIEELNDDSLSSDIVEVKEMYDSLNSKQKDSLENYAHLEEMLDLVDKRLVSQVDETIEKCQEYIDKDDPESAKIYYDSAMDYYNDLDDNLKEQVAHPEVLEETKKFIQPYVDYEDINKRCKKLAKESLKEALYVPSTLKVLDSEVWHSIDGDDLQYVCIHYTADNRLGGTNESSYFCRIENGVVEAEDIGEAEESLVDKLDVLYCIEHTDMGIYGKYRQKGPMNGD